MQVFVPGQTVTTADDMRAFLRGQMVDTADGPVFLYGDEIGLQAQVSVRVTKKEKEKRPVRPGRYTGEGALCRSNACYCRHCL